TARTYAAQLERAGGKSLQRHPYEELSVHEPFTIRARGDPRSIDGRIDHLALETQALVEVGAFPPYDGARSILGSQISVCQSGGHGQPRGQYPHHAHHAEDDDQRCTISLAKTADADSTDSRDLTQLVHRPANTSATSVRRI